jgi:hypothetical protein
MLDRLHQNVNMDRREVQYQSETTDENVTLLAITARFPGITPPIAAIREPLFCSNVQIGA